MKEAMPFLLYSSFAKINNYKKDLVTTHLNFKPADITFQLYHYIKKLSLIF